MLQPTTTLSNGASRTQASANVTRADFALNEQRTLQKLAESCQRERDITIERKAKGNWCITLSAAAYANVSKSLTNLIRLKWGSRATQHVDHKTNMDKNGLLVSELYQVKKWAAITKAGSRLAASLNGPCTISINLFATTSLILINGKDADTFMEIAAPALKEHLDQYQPELTEVNQDLLALIRGQKTKPPGRSNQRHNSRGMTEAAASDETPEMIVQESEKQELDSRGGETVAAIKGNETAAANAQLLPERTEDNSQEVLAVTSPNEPEPPKREETCIICANGAEDTMLQSCGICNVYIHAECEGIQTPTSEYMCRSCTILVEDPDENKGRRNQTDGTIQDPSPLQQPAARVVPDSIRNGNNMILQSVRPMRGEPRSPSDDPDWRNPQTHLRDINAMLEENERQKKIRDQTIRAKDNQIRKLEDTNTELKEQLEEHQHLARKMQDQIKILKEHNNLLQLKVDSAQTQPGPLPQQSHSNEHHPLFSYPPPPYYQQPGPNPQFSYPPPPLYSYPPPTFNPHSGLNPAGHQHMPAPQPWHVPPAPQKSSEMMVIQDLTSILKDLCRHNGCSCICNQQSKQQNSKNKKWHKKNPPKSLKKPDDKDDDQTFRQEHVAATHNENRAATLDTFAAYMEEQSSYPSPNQGLDDCESCENHNSTCSKAMAPSAMSTVYNNEQSRSNEIGENDRTDTHMWDKLVGQQDEPAQLRNGKTQQSAEKEHSKNEDQQEGEKNENISREVTFLGRVGLSTLPP